MRITAGVTPNCALYLVIDARLMLAVKHVVWADDESDTIQVFSDPPTVDPERDEVIKWERHVPKVVIQPQFYTIWINVSAEFSRDLMNVGTVRAVEAPPMLAAIFEGGPLDGRFRYIEEVLPVITLPAKVAFRLDGQDGHIPFPLHEYRLRWFKGLVATYEFVR